MMPGNYVDLSAFPLVYFRAIGPATVEHAHEIAHLYDQLYARGEEFLSLCDSRGPQRLEPGYQKVLKEHIDRTVPLSKRYCLLSLLVIDNMVARALLRGMYLLWGEINPTRVVGTLEEAAQVVERLPRWRKDPMPRAMAETLRTLHRGAIPPNLTRVARGKPLPFP